MVVGNSRPYPETGLCTALWMQLPLRELLYRDLVSTQEGVKIAGLLGMARFSVDPFPHVVRWQGKFYLEDGHTRVVRAMLKGDSRGWFRVYDSTTTQVVMT